MNHFCVPAIRFYPISPKRAIIFTHKLVPELPYKCIPLKKDLLMGAGMFNGILKLPVMQMCGIDVRFVNDLSKQFAENGYISKLEN